MRAKIENKFELSKTKGFEERIKRLRYDFVYDYKNQKSRESLLMFIMDV